MKRGFEMDVTLRSRPWWKAQFLFLVMFIRTALADQVLFACNFENNCIDYLEQDQNDDIDFTLGEGWEGEWLTGPETDFTFRNSSGHYYYIDANGDSVQTGDGALIHLPELQRKFYEGLGRLSFAYHMYDGYSSRDQMGTLNVYLRCDEYYNVTFSVSGDQGEDWHFAEIPIECEEEPVQISFEGIRRGIQSDIAIDNIKFIDIFEGSPLPPATQSPGFGRSSSSWSTTFPGGGRPSVLDTTLFPGGGVISGRTTLPGGTGGITTPPDGDPALKEKPALNIIVPVSIAALVLLILIIILIAVLLVHKRRKTTKTGELAESPSQLYENNIFSEPSPNRKYESLQGPLNDGNRIYEELHHKKPATELRPNGVPDARCHTAGRMNGHVPPQLRRSMPELGNNFYDPIGEPISINNNARCDNYHNNYIDRSNTYHPGRVSYHSNQEDHPYFTLMPDVVSSTAYQDDRIVFTIPPPPSSTPPPLPPPPRDYDYGRPIEHDMDDDDDIHDANVYHDVLDVVERRPRSMNSDFEDDDDLGRHRMAVDVDDDLRLNRDRVPHDLDIDMEIDMQMAEEGAVDIHGLDTLKMTRELERERRARELEIERNLDRPHRRVGGSVDRRRDLAAQHDYDDESTRRYPPPYSHHIEEDATGHIRMVNLNYNPSVVHV